MDRRDFIRLASCAGVSLVSTSSWSRPSASNQQAAGDPYTGPLFLVFHASGGWDPTHLCDAKIKSGENDPDPMTNLLSTEVETEHGITYPAFFNPDIYGADAGAFIPEFFRKHSARLRVINGIDMQTNGHDSGTRYTWSGRLSEGAPTLAAYLAASYDPTLPMSFLSFGGYGFTAGVSAQTRAGNLDPLMRAAFPFEVNPGVEQPSRFHSARAEELIAQAQFARDGSLLDRQHLPHIDQAINTLFTSRSGSNELRLLREYLPEELPANQTERSIALAMASYQAGITVSVNLSTGGFDTHGNHDRSQIPRLNDLLLAVDYAWEEAGRRGIQDNIVVMVGSDFGRTPGYNAGNGKDHWSVNSMMFMGTDISPGVVGGTSDRHQAYGVTTSLELDTSEGAMKIRPGHIHQAVRDKFAFGADNELAALFPISEDPLPLLG